MAFKSGNLNSDSENVIKKVENINQAQGTNAAYKALRKEYENYVNNPSHSQSQDAAFLKEVTTGLKSQMPDLSVAWGKEQLEPGYSNFDKKLNQKNIEADGNKRDIDAQGNEVTPFDQTMSKELIGQYSDLAHSRPVLGLFGPKYISEGDLNSKLKQIDENKIKQENLIKNQNFDKPIAQTLMTNGGELFSTIAGIKNGSADGTITKSDLEQYIKTVNANPNGALARNVDQFQMSVVNELAQNWDSPQIKLLHPNGHISVDSLASGAGYTSVKSMINAANFPNAENSSSNDANNGSFVHFNNWDKPIVQNAPDSPVPANVKPNPETAAPHNETKPKPEVTVKRLPNGDIIEPPHKDAKPKPEVVAHHKDAKPKPEANHEYEVGKGDNFWSIARKLHPGEHNNAKLGGFVKEMEKLNPQIKNFNLIRPGEKIKLPGQTPVSKDTPIQPESPKLSPTEVTKPSSPEVTKPSSPEVTKPSSPEVTKPSSSEAQAAKSELFGTNSGSEYSVRTETYTAEGKLDPTSSSGNSDTPIIVPPAKVQSEKIAINPNDLNVKPAPIVTDSGTSQNMQIANDLLANNGKLYNDINSVTSSQEISQSGLQAYVAFVKGNPDSSLAKDVSPEQFKAVENLTNNWNSADIQKMVDKNGNMSPDSIALGLGDNNSIAVGSPLLNPAENNFEYLRQTDNATVNTLFAENGKIYNDINSVTSSKDLSQSGLEAYVTYIKGNPQSRLANDITPEQFQIIQNLAQNWQTPNVQSLLDKSGNLNLDSVAQGLGYSNNELLAKEGNGNTEGGNITTANPNKLNNSTNTGNPLIDGSFDAKNMSQITGNPLIDGYFTNP